jgi:predicted component of type VI protein secretion system
MHPTRRTLLPLFAILALLALGACVSACGYSSNSKQTNEGEPLQLGELEYNVTFSRYLNPNDSEDAAYLVGQKEAPKGESYFGIFFEVQNKSDEPQTLPSSLTITDAEDKEYTVLPSESIFALPFEGTVEAEEQIPVLDSPAQQGPIEGSVAIFLLPEEASENRPLTLHIEGAEEKGEVTLDL